MSCLVFVAPQSLWGIPGSLKKPESTPAPCGSCACGSRRPTEAAKNLLGCPGHRGTLGARVLQVWSRARHSFLRNPRRQNVLGNIFGAGGSEKRSRTWHLQRCTVAMWFTKTALACLGKRVASFGVSSQSEADRTQHARKFSDPRKPWKGGDASAFKKSAAMRSSRVNSLATKPTVLGPALASYCSRKSRSAFPVMGGKIQAHFYRRPLLLPVDSQPSCHKGEAPKRSSFMGAGVCLLGRM